MVREDWGRGIGRMTLANRSYEFLWFGSGLFVAVDE